MNTRLENGRFLEINELFAFISKDENGNEGVMAVLGPDGIMMPLIGADTMRTDALRPVADMISSATGMKYELRHFKRVMN